MIFTPDQRRRLALKGKALTPEDRKACCQIVRPEAILAWFRHLSAKKYDSSHRRRMPGRPRKADDIRALVIKLATENPGWGYTKIRDALRGLQIEIGRTTVASILADAGLEPAPERSRRRTWRQFLRSHWETLYACDFFRAWRPTGSPRFDGWRPSSRSAPRPASKGPSSPTPKWTASSPGSTFAPCGLVKAPVGSTRTHT
jgi:hypothetical protein